MPPIESSSSRDDPGITVWLVEDDPLFRDTVEKLLSEDEEIQVQHTFETCEAALELLDDDFAPEVFLLDVSLPGISGIEGLPRIKALSPASHLVILTVHEDNDKIFRAICAGASGYLLKPSSGPEIKAAIRAARTGGAPINPQIADKMLTMFSELAVPKGDYGLSDREREVLEALVEGGTKQRIADDLHISYHTVDMHVRNIYEKLQVHSRSGAVAKALKERLI